MRDPGEMVNKTLLREFTEEALNEEIKFDKSGKMVAGVTDLEKQLEKFFKNGTQVISYNIFIHINKNIYNH
jgi:hypothetical protein